MYRSLADQPQHMYSTYELLPNANFEATPASIATIVTQNLNLLRVYGITHIISHEVLETHMNKTLLNLHGHGPSYSRKFRSGGNYAKVLNRKIK
jgi:hypothetical protein